MRRQRRRQLVSEAALFDRVGYHAVNVEALAHSAGLRKATLYHFFSDVGEILF